MLAPCHIGTLNVGTWAGAVATILIVDDDQDLPAWGGMVLTSAGHRVLVAANGQDGLAVLQDLIQRHEALPDLVLLDIEMPVMDGPTMALHMLIANCGRERIPIVRFSALGEIANVARGLGTPYFLPKPTEIADILGTVARVLHERIPPHVGAAVETAHDAPNAGY